MEKDDETDADEQNAVMQNRDDIADRVSHIVYERLRAAVMGHLELSENVKLIVCQIITQTEEEVRGEF